MMQALEQHLHAGFADLLLLHAHSGKRRIHQKRFLTIVESHQTDLTRHFHTVPRQRTPQSVRNFVVAGYHRRGSRPLRQDSPGALLAEVYETLGILRHDQDRLQLLLAHSTPVTLEPAMKPGVGNVSGENNLAMSLADKVTRRVQRAVEIIEPHLIELLLFVNSHHIVAESNERHMDGSDPAQQIRITRAGKNHSVDQDTLLKDGRQIDSVRRCS